MNFEAKLEAFYNCLDLVNTVAIDIGANVGRHSVPLAKKLGDGGFLYAFEPIPVIRKLLIDNIFSSSLNNVAVFPCALSNVNKVSEFIYIPNLPEESGLKKRHRYNAVPENEQIIKVGTFRLDDLISTSKSISFIKIDVEGGELDVLRGAKEVLKSSQPIVAFECGASSYLGYHETPDEIFEIFSSLGYSIFSILGEEMSNCEQFSKETHAQKFWDYIALPNSKKELSSLLQG